MAVKNIDVRHQQKYDTEANWIAEDPVLLEGEIGIESDTGNFKFGNGVDEWTELEYFASGGGGGGHGFTWGQLLGIP